jgi:hypothetical protein
MSERLFLCDESSLLEIQCIKKATFSPREKRLAFGIRESWAHRPEGGNPSLVHSENDFKILNAMNRACSKFSA